MAWLTDNLGTIIISLILLVVVGLVIYKMICNVKNPPEPVLRQAKEWLRDHGYLAMIQPYVIHDIRC